MAYRFKTSDKSVQAGLRRITREQIDKALVSLEATGESRPGAIHDVRKRCKKLRGLIRLVRPSFADFSRENAAFREISGLLGGPRDAKVMQDTYDAIMADYEGVLAPSRLEPVRHRLTELRQAELADTDLDESFSKARELLGEARERAAGWSLEAKGWDALGPGLARTYGRARKEMRRAAKHPTAEQHHEWRKRVKYHWYHTRLLRELWPDHMVHRAELAHVLSGYLGDHHDCHVFEHTVLEDPSCFAGPEEVEAIVALARRRRARLEERAHRLGKRLLADSPEVLVKRWSAWWDSRDDEADLREAALERT